MQAERGSASGLQREHEALEGCGRQNNGPFPAVDRDVTAEAGSLRCNTAGLGDVGRCHKPRNMSHLQKLEKARGWILSWTQI